MTQLLNISPDIAGMILSYTSDTVTLSVLQLCGNKALTHLIGRSVREITCKVDNGMSWAAENILLLPRLTSFTLTVKAAPFKSLLTIITSLPSTLLKLRVDTFMSRSVFQRKKTARDDEDPNLKHFKREEYVVQCLDERFPLLQYCYIPDSLQFEWPAEVKLHFVQHLPRSLTFLHLRSLADLPVAIWQLLPPNLVSLNSTTYLLPSKVTFPPSLFNSLQSLDLDLHSSQSYSYFRENVLPNTPIGENGVPISNKIELPPNLTSLTTTLSGLIPAEVSSNFNSLAFLHLHSRGTKISLAKLLASLPPCLYSLTLQRLEVVYEEASRETFLPTLRVLKLDQMCFSSPYAHAFLLRAFPNLQTYDCQHLEGTDGEISPVTLAMLNPKTLTRLRSPFAVSTFSAPEDAALFAIGNLLPNLKIMDVIEPGNERDKFAQTFHLRGLPTSLHSLSIEMESFFVKDTILKDLPPHITSLKIPRLSFTGTVPEIDSCVFFSAGTPSVRATADTFYLPKAALLTLDNDKNTTNRFKLTPAIPSTPAFITMQLEDAKMQLPSTLQTIKVSAPAPAPPSFNLAGNTYPNLTKLWLLEPPNKAIKLEFLVSLRSLTIMKLKTGKFDKLYFPPALLTFKTDSPLVIPSGHAFMLPGTLTKLSAHDFSPAHLLTLLPHLTSLSIFKGSYASSELQEVVVKLQKSSLTHLRLQMKLTIPLMSSFTHLQVWSRPFVTDTFIRFIQDRNDRGGSVKLRLEDVTLFKIDDPKRLAASIGMSEAKLDSLLDSHLVGTVAKVERALECAFTCLGRIFVTA